MWILFLVSGTGISQVKTEEIKNKKKVVAPTATENWILLHLIFVAEKRNCKMVKYILFKTWYI